MEKKKFKTSAKCGGCVARISEKLDALVPRSQWTIDLSSPERVLEITTDLPDEKIAGAVEAAGYTAQRIG